MSCSRSQLALFFLLSRNIPPEVLACHRDWVVLSGYDWGKCDGDDTTLELWAQPSQGIHWFMVFAFISDPSPSHACEKKEEKKTRLGKKKRKVCLMWHSQTRCHIFSKSSCCSVICQHAPAYSHLSARSPHPSLLTPSLPPSFRFPHSSHPIGRSTGQWEWDLWQQGCLGNEEVIWRVPSHGQPWSVLQWSGTEWDHTRACLPRA